MLDLLDLPLAQQTVIHEHAGELVADGLVHQGGGHGGVHAAGQAADHLGVAHLGADLGHLVLDDAGGVPIRAKAGALMQEGLDELLPHRRVLDLRMPLHTVQLARGILHGGHRRALGVRKHLEALGCGLHGHAMAHPHALIRRGAVQQTLGLIDYRGGLAVLAQRGLVHLAAQFIGHNLEAVADTQHRHARLEHLAVDARRARFEHRSRTAGQDDGLGILGQHLINRHRMGHQFRIHVRLTHAAGDQLGVLGSEINNKNRTCGHEALLFHRGGVNRSIVAVQGDIRGGAARAINRFENVTTRTIATSNTPHPSPRNERAERIANPFLLDFPPFSSIFRRVSVFTIRSRNMNNTVNFSNNFERSRKKSPQSRTFLVGLRTIGRGLTAESQGFRQVRDRR